MSFNINDELMVLVEKKPWNLMKIQLLIICIRKLIEQLKRAWYRIIGSDFVLSNLLLYFRLLKLKPLPSWFQDCGWDLSDTGIKVIRETAKEGCEWVRWLNWGIPLVVVVWKMDLQEVPSSWKPESLGWLLMQGESQNSRLWSVRMKNLVLCFPLHLK